MPPASQRTPSNDHCPLQSIRRPSQAEAFHQAGESLPGAGIHPQYVVDETRPSNLDHLQRGSPSSGVADSVIRTVVSTGNDALNILFEAASHERDAILNGYNSPVNDRMSQQTGSLETSPNNTLADIPDPRPEVLRIWGNCRFVTMGWLTAKDAVVYLDLYLLLLLLQSNLAHGVTSSRFFRDMSPLSPVLTDYYASHDHHYELITYEPMLCCTILLISSRYHVLPGLAGLSKGYFLQKWTLETLAEPNDASNVWSGETFQV